MICKSINLLVKRSVWSTPVISLSPIINVSEILQIDTIR